MSDDAFVVGPVLTDNGPVQGIVLTVGKETIDVDTSRGVLRNVKIAAPLTIEQVKLKDVVALLVLATGVVAFAILGQYNAMASEPYRDRMPPPAVGEFNTMVLKSGVVQLWWEYDYSAVPDFAYFEVDGKIEGGDYDAE